MELAVSLSGLADIGVITAGVIGIIGFLFGLATLLGGNYRVAKHAKVLADYEAGYNAVKVKAEGQEQEISELQRQNRLKDSRIAELENELHALQGRMAVLQEVVTGKSAIEQLNGQMVALADTMNKRADMVNNRVGEALAQVGELRAEVREAHSGILSAVQKRNS